MWKEIVCHFFSLQITPASRKNSMPEIIMDIRTIKQKFILEYNRFFCSIAYDCACATGRLQHVWPTMRVWSVATTVAIIRLVGGYYPPINFPKTTTLAKLCCRDQNFVLKYYVNIMLIIGGLVNEHISKGILTKIASYSCCLHLEGC